MLLYVNVQGDHNARVAAFVKDLLAADEDEAELPARAARRPVVLATAVQSELVAGCARCWRVAILHVFTLPRLSTCSWALHLPS
jgi:hypothetical protein